MGYFRDRFNINNATTVYSIQDQEFLKALGIDINTIDQQKLGEITYFVCIKHLSECMGKLNISQYKEDSVRGKEKVRGFYLNPILNLEPNPYMTASTFWQTTEFQRNHFGNAFIYIERYKIGKNAGKVKALWILSSENVQVWIDDKGYFGQDNAIWYLWNDPKTGKPYKFSHKEILHFKTSISWDGITGLSIKDILKSQIDQAKYGQRFLSKLYKNNMFGGKVILQYTGDLDTKGERALANKIESYSSSVGSGKFIPLPLGLTASTLDMKLSDAEFTELNKLNALQIASAFGVKPNIINNYDKSSYSNSESQQLDFYVNSFMPIIKQYKEENTRKILASDDKLQNNTLEHDIKSLFKMDSKTQMEVLKTGMNNFMVTPNEAREELGLPWREGGDILVGNGNYIKLDQIGTQWDKSIKDKEVNTEDEEQSSTAKNI